MKKFRIANNSLLVCGSTGYPLTHSLSPAIHNAGYKALGIPFVFLKFESKDVFFVIRAMREFGWRGLAVTMPHKIAALKHLDTLDPLARKIGAINTIVNTEGTLKGYNTDAVAIQKLLRAKNDLKGKRVLVLGAGGAARAAVAILSKEKANITIAVRHPAHAFKLSKEFATHVIPLHKLNVSLYDVIINATPSGMKPRDQHLFDYTTIEPHHLVYDFVYQPVQTPLTQAALSHKAKIIYGHDMLLEQAYEQFRLFTGRAAPRDVMRKALHAQLH